MEMFTTPRLGRYVARTRNFDGSFNEFNTSCLIFGESDRSYIISLSIPLNGHKPYERLTVRKHNVRMKKQPVEYDYSGAWWNN